MKYLSKVQAGLIVCLLPTFAFADFNYPCSGAPGAYRVNPDLSVGGYVANTASVDNTVIITTEASVCDRATVLEGAFITDKAVVEGKATVRGKVVISGSSKVHGEAYVINTNGTDLVVADQARIYGHAFLQGSVLISGTSEVFGWGKVLDFSQLLGHTTVCGSSVVKNQTVLEDDATKCVQK